jgi:hypothetical protein
VCASIGVKPGGALTIRVAENGGGQDYSQKQPTSKASYSRYRHRSTHRIGLKSFTWAIPEIGSLAIRKANRPRAVSQFFFRSQGRPEIRSVLCARESCPPLHRNRVWPLIDRWMREIFELG